MDGERGAYQRCDPCGSTLVGRLDAGPVRLRRNGRQSKAVGLYFSVKSGRHLPYESKLELHDLWRAEVDASVVRSYPQPFTLKFVHDGEARRFTPDRLDRLADGGMVVTEIKDVVSDVEARCRYAPIVELLAEGGCRFELRQRREIDAQPMLSGVEAVQRWRRTQLSEAQAAWLRRRLASGSALLGDLAEEVQPGPGGWALVCAAAVRRVVSIDLSAGLHGDAAVERIR